MIRINDRTDPQQGSVEVPGTNVLDAGRGRKSFVVSPGEFTARLTATVARDRFLVAIGDPVGEEGVAPDVWYGVVESWQPAGSKVTVIARPARTVDESVHP